MKIWTVKVKNGKCVVVLDTRLRPLAGQLRRMNHAEATAYAKRQNELKEKVAKIKIKN